MNGYIYHDDVPEFNPVLDEAGLLEANRRHDAAAHTVSMKAKAKYQRVNPDRYALLEFRKSTRA